MELTYRGIRYTPNASPMEALASVEPGMFRGVPIDWKRYHCSNPASNPESLHFLGRRYSR